MYNTEGTNNYGGVLPFMQLSKFMPFLGAKPNRVLGVFFSAEVLFLVELERLEAPNRFRVRQAREEKWRETGAPWEDASAFSEMLMRLCVTCGLSSDTISLCLPRELFFIYEREFPPMEREELEAAARWDIETNVPFDEGAYWPGFGKHEEQLELAALPSEYGRDFVNAMTASGLGVSGLTMEPLRFSCRHEAGRVVWRDAAVELSAPAEREQWTRGLSTALYAALRFYIPAVGVEFLPGEEKAERARLWQAAGYFLLAGTLLLVSIVFVRNWLLLSAAEARLDNLRQEYAMEKRARETMEGLTGGQAEIERAEKALRKLSAERRSWYAVMSALGTVGVDGVYLTEFDVQEDGAVLCGGRATDHGHLVAYMDRLGNEVRELREKPLLKESAADERGELRFKLRLRF